MVSKKEDQSDTQVDRFPQTLGLKDLVTIVSISVTLALAWGVFGTRLTVLENDVIAIKQATASTAASITELSRMVERVKDQQVRHDIFIDQLYEAVHKKPLRKMSDPP
jgi:hypothetical protein